MANRKRGNKECYSAYKQSLRDEEKAIKKHLRGVTLWDSYVDGPLKFRHLYPKGGKEPSPLDVLSRALRA